MKLTAISSAIALATGITIGVYVTANIWQAKWADAENKQAQNQLAAVNHAVQDYQAKLTRLEGVENDTRIALANALRDADRATTVNNSLQQQLSDYVRKSSGRAEAASSPAECAAIATDLVVLSELFNRANRRAEELAKVADESRTRGLACEASYRLLQ